MELEIKNAKIKSTSLGVEDHGIFTAYLNIEGDGWGCGFGGFGLDEYSKNEGKRIGHAFGVDFIKGILETLDVLTWEKLPGTFLRVEAKGLGGGITRIGHPIKEVWFDPKELAEKVRERVA